MTEAVNGLAGIALGAALVILLLVFFDPRQ